MLKSATFIAGCMAVLFGVVVIAVSVIIRAPILSVNGLVCIITGGACFASCKLEGN